MVDIEASGLREATFVRTFSMQKFLVLKHNPAPESLSRTSRQYEAAPTSSNVINRLAFKLSGKSDDTYAEVI